MIYFPFQCIAHYIYVMETVTKFYFSAENYNGHANEGV